MAKKKAKKKTKTQPQAEPPDDGFADGTDPVEVTAGADVGDVCMETLMARLSATAEVQKDGDTIAVSDEPGKIKDTLALASRLMLGLRKEGKIKTLPKLVKGK